MFDFFLTLPPSSPTRNDATETWTWCYSYLVNIYSPIMWPKWRKIFLTFFKCTVEPSSIDTSSSSFMMVWSLDQNNISKQIAHLNNSQFFFFIIPVQKHSTSSYNYYNNDQSLSSIFWWFVSGILCDLITVVLVLYDCSFCSSEVVSHQGVFYGRLLILPKVAYLEN